MNLKIVLTTLAILVLVAGTVLAATMLYKMAFSKNTLSMEIEITDEDGNVHVLEESFWSKIFGMKTVSYISPTGASIASIKYTIDATPEYDGEISEFIQDGVVEISVRDKLKKTYSGAPPDGVLIELPSVSDSGHTTKLGEITITKADLEIYTSDFADGDFALEVYVRTNLALKDIYGRRISREATAFSHMIINKEMPVFTYDKVNVIVGPFIST